MPTDFEQLSDAIEECYEFTLSYAAQGHAGEGSVQVRALREHMTRAVEAMRGLETSCTATLKREQLSPAAPYEAFFRVLARDAEDAIAAFELVLAQPGISSQLIDNLNASIHVRALLTDLFLVADILETQQAQAVASKHAVD